MFTTVLQMNLNDGDRRYFLPQDLWVAILDRFVLSNCSSIGFSGIEGTADVSKIECFSDWQPHYVGCGNVSMSWQNVYSRQVVRESQFGLFEYSKELHDRMCKVENTAWRVYDEHYPADELYFFHGDQILLLAAPFEKSVLFCELNDQQREKLVRVDNRIAPNLRRIGAWKIFSEVSDYSVNEVIGVFPRKNANNQMRRYEKHPARNSG
jgi:hypothetical protein